MADPSFWERERRAFEAAFTGMTIDILLASGEAGAAALPLAYRGLVDWDYFNRAALEWAHLYFGTLDAGPIGGTLVSPGAQAWARALNETTRKQFMREFETWVVSGEPLPSFEARITPLFSRARAGRIAATEVTRIYAAGNMTSWAASGVVEGLVWRTSKDGRVCPLCGAMNGKLVDFGRGWQFSQERMAQSAALRSMIGKQGGLVMSPPAHVACRCWLAPAVFDAMTEKEIADARWTG
jgi:SPP1 gp7 family putative phage head morphogenesis protein